MIPQEVDLPALVNMYLTIPDLWVYRYAFAQLVYLVVSFGRNSKQTNDVVPITWTLFSSRSVHRHRHVVVSTEVGVLFT